MLPAKISAPHMGQLAHGLVDWSAVVICQLRQGFKEQKPQAWPFERFECCGCLFLADADVLHRQLGTEGSAASLIYSTATQILLAALAATHTWELDSCLQLVRNKG